MAVPEFNTTWNMKRTTYQFDCFNSGVMVIDCDKISQSWMNYWIDGLKSHKRSIHYQDGDQLMLYQMFPDYTRLPYKYNVLNYLYQKYQTSTELSEFELKVKSELPSIDDIKMIHYSFKQKPWNCSDLYLSEIYNKYRLE